MQISVVPVYRFRLKIPAAGLSALGLVGGDGGDGAFDELKFQVVRQHAHDDDVLLDLEHGSAETAVGGDFVAGLETRKHELPRLLLLLVGRDHEKVHRRDKDDRQRKRAHGAEIAEAAGALQIKC